MKPVKTIDEFVEVFEKVAGKFRWKLCQGRIRIQETGLCPIEAVLGGLAFVTSSDAGWDRGVVNVIVNSADNRNTNYSCHDSTYRLDPKLRARLLELCGLEELKS